VLVLLASLAVACTPGGQAGQAQRQAAAGDLQGARVALERQRQQQPRSVDVRVALGEAYYRIAREALDRDRDEAAYLSYLERSVVEFVKAVELDPRDERPHFFLAIMDTYRGDLARALRGFNNARRLKPDGVAYTNIAEIYVYKGHLHKARRWNELGLKKRAPYGAVVFNDMLIAWREGDVHEARLRFAQLKARYPDMLETINVARVPRPPRDFEDFAGYCCGSPACGPYMKDACLDLSLAVQQREISEEAVLKELRIEMERERRMRKVYQQRKELEIGIDPEPSAP
jgi:tetratricopeptide (TPR) repeat protein